MRGAVLVVLLVLSAVAIAFAVGVTAESDGVDDGERAVEVETAVAATETAPDEVRTEEVTADTVLGDVTQTGAVTLTDAILIQEEIAGVRDGETEFFEPAADLNRDGDIGLTDGILAQEKLAGILEEGELAVSNLDGPEEVTSGEEIEVSADLENLGDEGALQDIELRIAPEGEPLDENATVTETFVDVAAPGVENPVDRPAETTVTFENVTTDDLEGGEYEYGLFSADANVTGAFSVEPVELSLTAGDAVATAGEEGTIEVTVQANGDAVAGEEVSLDDADGLDVDQDVVETGPDGVAAFTFTEETAGEYIPEFSAEDGETNDTATVTVEPDPNAQRSIEQDEAEAGETVNVTVTAELPEPMDFALIETYEPTVADSSLQFPPLFYSGEEFIAQVQEFDEEGGFVTQAADNFPEEGSGTLAIHYEIELPADATEGEEFGYDEDASTLELEGQAFDIGGDDTITIVEDGAETRLQRPAMAV